MSMIYILIPLALVMLALAVWALLWAIRSGQFDDLDSQGWSVILDDDSNFCKFNTVFSILFYYLPCSGK